LLMIVFFFSDSMQPKNKLAARREEAGWKYAGCTNGKLQRCSRVVRLLNKE